MDVDEAIHETGEAFTTQKFGATGFFYPIVDGSSHRSRSERRLGVEFLRVVREIKVIGLELLLGDLELYHGKLRVVVQGIRQIARFEPAFERFNVLSFHKQSKYLSVGVSLNLQDLL